jgi:hypothetical protein
VMYKEEGSPIQSTTGEEGTQANYSSREALEKLTTAVNKWNAGTGRALCSNGEKPGFVKFFIILGIPFDTSRTYAHLDPEKIREVAKAFMTEEVWVQATPSIIKGLRSTDPIVQVNHQWWVLEVFDGNGPHMMSLPAMQLCYDCKILSSKEEGDSSHVNQAFVKLVAPANKSVKKESLAMLWGCTLGNKWVVDQQCIIHVGMFVIQALRKAGTRTNSIKSCNIDPPKSIPFRSGAAGQLFKMEGRLNTSCSPTIILAWDDSRGEEEDRQYHRYT